MHQSQLLTNASVQYKPQGLIAQDILPQVAVRKRTDKILNYGNEGRRLDLDIRAAGSVAKSATYSISNTTYYLTQHALRGAVYAEDRENADAPEQVDVSMAQTITDKLMLRMENDAEKALFTSTTWGNAVSLASTTAWRYNTTSSSDPVMNVHSASGLILTQSGAVANRIIIGNPLYVALLGNVWILDRVKWAQLGIIGSDLLAAVWDLENVHVGKASYQTAAEGLAETYTAMWGAHALVYYAPPTASLRSASAGMLLKMGNLFSVRRYNSEPEKCDWVEVEAEYQFKALATLSAVIFTNAGT
jgi:hypothetical protein